MSNKMQNKTRYFNHLITFMQRRMRDKCVTIDAKIEVMRIHIDHIMFKWGLKAIMYKDDSMKKLLERFKNIKPMVLTFLLKNYIRQCKRKHSIAFLEWRLHFCKNRK